MSNRFYTPGPGRAARVDDLFARIAGRYDLINDLQSLGWHRLWKRRLARLSGADEGKRVLDVCCGTGDVARMLAARGAQVVGMDFSSAMLTVARRRFVNSAVRRGGSPLWLQGDALKLPFQTETFDAVTISYGLRNLADFRLGLAEMWRVLKVEGRLLVLDFGKPAHPVWRKLYFAYLQNVVPWFGRLFCGDAQTYSYIHESLQAYPAQQGVAAWLHELGANRNRIVSLWGGVMTINWAEKPHGLSINGSGRLTC